MSAQPEVTHVVSCPTGPLTAKRRFRIILPVPGDETRQIDICQCTTPDAAGAIVSALLGAQSGGPVQIRIEVFYGE
jgi:hypothetical protein